MKQTIELECEQIDAIVVGELKHAYEINLKCTKDEGGFDIDPDGELANALKVVLQYFMSKYDYDDWIEQYESRN